MGTEERPLGVLIVDDDERFAAALVALVESDARLAVLGWAADGAEAFAQVARTRPDVITMDIDMPKMDGVEAIRLIVAHDPSIPIVVVTGSLSSERVAEALAAGAADHVPKWRAADDLPEALVAVAGPVRR